MKIVNLFGDVVDERQPSKGHRLFDDYDAFCKKFERKKTSDDCYTPPAVYSAVLEWLSGLVDLSDKNICRPFYPGGDYEAEVYGANDVVVDNPPFSIICSIIQFYMSRGVKFFLFAPALTAFKTIGGLCYVYSGAQIIYNNGAGVATAFITNLFEGEAIRLAPELGEKINAAGKHKKNNMLKYVYPDNVITSANLNTLAANGCRLVLYDAEVSEKINCLNSQKSVGKTSFGGCMLISDSAVKKYKAAIAQRAAKNAPIFWELSDYEKTIIDQLNKNENDNN